MTLKLYIYYSFTTLHLLHSHISILFTTLLFFSIIFLSSLTTSLFNHIITLLFIIYFTLISLHNFFIFPTLPASLKLLSTFSSFNFHIHSFLSIFSFPLNLFYTTSALSFSFLSSFSLSFFFLFYLFPLFTYLFNHLIHLTKSISLLFSISSSSFFCIHLFLLL